MEIALVAENALRIKGKQGAVVVDPSSALRTKTQADAVIVFANTTDLSFGKIEEHRVIISGPGEYEIAGMKISGTRVLDTFLYELRFDGLSILLAKAGRIEGVKEKANQCQVLVLLADATIDPSLVTALEPNAVVLYGEKAVEEAKLLGKSGGAVEKYSVTGDKLPAEMEVVVLQ